jgi:PhnB protein
MLEKDKDIATINPYLVVPNLDDAAEYYLEAFGARQAERYEDQNGKVWYAVLKVFGVPLQVMEPDHEMGLRAKDPEVDKEDHFVVAIAATNPESMFKRALGAGSEQMSDFYTEGNAGHGEIRDPFGHRWIVGTRQNPKDRRSSALSPQVVVENVADYVRFASEVYGAKESRAPLLSKALDRRVLGDVAYTTAKIRGASLQITAANAGRRLAAAPRDGSKGDTFMITVAVDDVDTTFDRAIARGAVAVVEPQDAYWGDRYAEFRDLAGLRIACCGPTTLAEEVVDPPMLQKELNNFLDIHGMPSSPAGAVNVQNVGSQ